MRNASRLALFSYLALCFCGCGEKSAGVPGSPRDTSPVISMISDAPDASKLGVFASTNDGLKELLVYGEQTGETSYRAPSTAGAPTVASVKAFYINMPNSNVMSSKVFVEPSRDLAPTFTEAASHSVPVSFESVKGNLYRVVLPDLGKRPGSLLLLKVSMPLGTPDRIYAINLGS